VCGGGGGGEIRVWAEPLVRIYNGQTSSPLFVPLAVGLPYGGRRGFGARLRLIKCAYLGLLDSPLSTADMISNRSAILTHYSRGDADRLTYHRITGSFVAIGCMWPKTNWS